LEASTPALPLLVLGVYPPPAASMSPPCWRGGGFFLFCRCLVSTPALHHTLRAGSAVQVYAPTSTGYSTSGA